MEIRFAITNATIVGTPPVTQDILVTDGAAASLTPKAAIYELTSAITNLTATNHYRYGVGITDGTTQRAHGFSCEDNGLVGVADCDYRHDTATVIQFPLTTSGAIDGEASWDSWQTGGSRISWGDLMASACKVKATYFYGDDIQCAVATVTGSSTQDGTASVTGLAFAPNFAFLISHYLPFAADGQENDAAMAMGYAIKNKQGEIQQVAFTDWNDDRANPTAGATVLRDDCCLAKVEETSDGARLELTSWNNDGATFTTRDTGTSLVAAVLFIKFGLNRNLQATIETIPADTSEGGGHSHQADTFEIETPIFAAEACFVITTPLSAKNVTERSANRSKWSHGIVDTDLANSSLILQAEDNSSTVSDTRSKLSQSQCGSLMSDTGSEFNAPFSCIFTPSVGFTAFSRESDSEGSDFLGAFVFIGVPEGYDRWLPARSGARWRMRLARM